MLLTLMVAVCERGDKLSITIIIPKHRIPYVMLQAFAIRHILNLDITPSNLHVIAVQYTIVMLW